MSAYAKNYTIRTVAEGVFRELTDILKTNRNKYYGSKEKKEPTRS